MGGKSNHTLAHHSAGDLLEACDVGTGNQVALHAVTLGCIGSVLVDVDHDVVQALVNLFKGPGEAQAVLAHFQAGSSNAAGVGCLSGSEQDTVALQVSDCFRGRRHVSTFSNSVAAVGNQCLGTFQLQLVLGCAGQSDIAGNSPDALAALNVLSGGNVIQVSLDAGTLDFLDFLDDLVVNAVLVHDVAVGVAHGDNLAAHLGSFLVCIGSNVAGAGDDHTLALKAATETADDYDFGVPGVPVFVTITAFEPDDPDYEEGSEFNNSVGAAVSDEVVGSGMHIKVDDNGSSYETGGEIALDALGQAELYECYVYRTSAGDYYAECTQANGTNVCYRTPSAKPSAPQVAYRETIRRPADQDTKYARQSGGKGQYGHVKIKIEPNEAGKGYEFVNAIVGGAIPKEFIGPIDQGIQGAMQAGVLAGYPVVDVKVTLYDGSYHEVDSSEMAFKIAGSMAFKEAMRKADPVILEPIMKVAVIVPDEYMGDVIGDINARRGQIQGTESRSGTQQIDALVPLSNMFGYATDLRSKTQGRGQYSMEPSHYIDVPKSIAESIMAGRAKKDLGSDLFLCIREKAAVWGCNEEFISSGRLDDQQCVFGILKGFLNAHCARSINVAAFFDNEEVGSGTKQGAASTFLYDVLHRIAQNVCPGDEDFHRAVASSFMFSADNAHAVHPNHPEYTDVNNCTYMNEGVVVKVHAGQKYTSDGMSMAVAKELAARAGVPLQYFANRSDKVGGSTLGNLAMAQVSMNCVDIGLPQLAMHSCYETAGARDIVSLIRLMEEFYASHFEETASGTLAIRK